MGNSVKYPPHPCCAPQKSMEKTLLQCLVSENMLIINNNHIQLYTCVTNNRIFAEYTFSLTKHLHEYQKVCSISPLPFMTKFAINCPCLDPRMQFSQYSQLDCVIR